MKRFLDRFCFAYILLASPSAVIHAHSWIEKVESVYGEGMSRLGMPTKSDVSLFIGRSLSSSCSCAPMMMLILLECMHFDIVLHHHHYFVFLMHENITCCPLPYRAPSSGTFVPSQILKIASQIQSIKLFWIPLP